VFGGRWQVLIYLFRDESTDNRALTLDVTGRNIPPVTSSTVWVFVEAVNTHSLPPRWDTAYAIRGEPGEDDRLLSLRARTGTTSSNANLLMRGISVRAVMIPEG